MAIMLGAGLSEHPTSLCEKRVTGGIAAAIKYRASYVFSLLMALGWNPGSSTDLTNTTAEPHPAHLLAF